MRIAVQRAREDWFNDEKPTQDAEPTGEAGAWEVNIRSLEHLLDFADTYGGLRIANILMIGGYGVGKTHLVTALLNTLRERGDN